jgi:hypothetical protein
VTAAAGRITKAETQATDQRGQADATAPKAGLPAMLQTLHRAIRNRALGRLVESGRLVGTRTNEAFIQRIADPAEEYRARAKDATPETAPTLLPEDETVQREADPRPMALPPGSGDLSSQLDAAKRAGQPLSTSTRYAASPLRNIGPRDTNVT